MWLLRQVTNKCDTGRKSVMKKRKMAMMLIFAMLMQTGVSINAEVVPEDYGTEPETSYVIVGEDKSAIEQVIGTELEE